MGKATLLHITQWGDPTLGGEGRGRWIAETRQTRPRSLLLLLVIGNATWAVLCLIAAVVVASYATRLGLAQLLLESVFVGVLAALEWRHREALSVVT